MIAGLPEPTIEEAVAVVFPFVAWAVAWGFVALKRRRFGVLSLLVLLSGFAVLMAIFVQTNWMNLAVFEFTGQFW